MQVYEHGVGGWYLFCLFYGEGGMFPIGVVIETLKVSRSGGGRLYGVT